MLIRFEVTNFRSIFDPIELSMVAVDRDRVEARPVRNIGASLLPVAAIYGPNASGKSNVIAALTWLLRAVRSSLRMWEDEVPVEPFAFAHGPERQTEFVIECIIAGIRFEYLVDVDRHAVRYEGLFHYPEKKRRRIFEREGDDLILQRGLGKLSGTRELLTPRTLALSIARRFDEPLVSDFTRHLLAIHTLRPPVGRGARLLEPTRSTWRWFDEPADLDDQSLLDLEELDDREQNDRKQALTLLQLADLGINDVVVDREESAADPTGDFGRAKTRRRIRFLHRTGADPMPLDLDEESAGTRSWYGLIGPTLHALRSGSLLLFDELDASLHPTLSAELVRLFHDPAINPHGAQLVFTAHDTSLLNHLNRDEVWLTEKTEHGTTRLGGLAEFAGERVRRSRNLERAYLHGRFGALPDTDRTDLLRSLGLIG